MAAIWQTFQIDFMRHALVAGVLVALACAYLGVFVVLRRIVFLGVALAEISSAGVALSLLLGIAPMLGAVGLMVLGVAAFSWRWSPRRVPQESYIGIGYAAAAALGILLVAKSAKGEAHMLQLLYGNVLTVSPAENLQMLALFAGVGLVLWLFSKELLLVSFDPDCAEAQGMRARLWNGLLYLLIGVVIAFSIRAVGVLLTFALLVLPAVTALLVTNRLRHAFSLAPLLAVVPVALGLHLSLVWDLPAAAAIVGLSCALLAPGLLLYRVRQRA